MLIEVSYAATLICWIVLERLVNATSVLLYQLVRGNKSDKLKNYAGIQLLGAGAGYATSVVNVVATAVSSYISLISGYVAFALVTSFFFAVLYVLQEYYPSVMVTSVTYWNELLGPIVHTIVIAPVEIFNLVFAAVIPLYNALVWLFTQIFYNVFVVSAIRDTSLYRDMGLGVAAFFRDLAVNGAAYVNTFAIPCEDTSSIECFSPANRVYDLITPMAGLRTTAIAAARCV